MVMFPRWKCIDPLDAHRTLTAYSFSFSDKDMHDVTAYLVTLEMNWIKLITPRPMPPVMLFAQSGGLSPT